MPELISWGFPNFKNKGVIINARAETAQEKPMFRESLLMRRCAVPSTGFFEWKHDASKQKYLFRLPQETMLYMAGFYNQVADSSGIPVPAFVILTTAANDSVSPLHNRMPLILDKETSEKWLYDRDAALQILLRPCAARLLVQKL
jgi:putative SOS response-associated peptidase YedK